MSLWHTEESRPEGTPPGAGGWAPRVFAIGRRLAVRGGQRCTDLIDSLDPLPDPRYVLYLRPFTNDITLAQALVRRFARFGRVVAVGRPGERPPPVGALRGQLPRDDWQGPVSTLIAGAHVVLMAAGPGPGTVWEFTEAVRLLDPARLVLLIYCDAETYDRFRGAVAAEYRRRLNAEPPDPDRPWPLLPPLPDYPGPVRPGRTAGARWDLVLKGVVVFAPDWTAGFIRFVPTPRRLPGPRPLDRLVDHALRPVMAQLDGLAAPRRHPSGTDLPD
ncbi:hypothetical protein [Streptacidiphilus anmyonensis]|uniref:hypothetical protein n=1 Tax=Streptacidiphilus anmyonensis TaxID=405782 RepID=UPI000694EAAF|nr:hypothetical protein [Streptacidiphilus anmyonensis]